MKWPAGFAETTRPEHGRSHRDRECAVCEDNSGNGTVEMVIGLRGFRCQWVGDANLNGSVSRYGDCSLDWDAWGRGGGEVCASFGR